jgi:hypothetical protein
VDGAPGAADASEDVVVGRASGDAAAELDAEDGGTIGTLDAEADAGAADGVVLDAEAPPLAAPAPTGAGAVSAAPQSSQYSAPAGFSCWQTWQTLIGHRSLS